MNIDNTASDFATDYIDLLSERLGGKALSCSDQWFAECSNLTKTSAPVFKAGYFVATGQWMDGWESRRSYGRAAHRSGEREFDWCILKLGTPGRIYGCDVETTHFKGNAPEFAALEGAWLTGEPDAGTQWFELLPKSPTIPDSHNEFAIAVGQPCTHVRLKIYPDGGVARLRLYGEAILQREHYVEGELIDLASAVNGGRGLACSDRFYSSPSNLLMPNRGVNMGDGWETKRRRDQNNDWCIVKLGATGSIRKVIVDTAHFKGNYPDRFSLQATNTKRQDITASDIEWHSVIAETPLQPDQEHIFIRQLAVSPASEFTHVRLNIYPDGGVSRLRILGSPNWDLLATTI